MRKLLMVLTVAVMLSGCASFIKYQNSPDYLCSDNSEVLYNKLLETKPYYDVRMAVGYWQNNPHQWVEVWEGGKWWIEDPSLGNFNRPEEYRTVHHLGWETIMETEYPDKLKERMK